MVVLPWVTLILAADCIKTPLPVSTVFLMALEPVMVKLPLLTLMSLLSVMPAPYTLPDAPLGGAAVSKPIKARSPALCVIVPLAKMPLKLLLEP